MKLKVGTKVTYQLNKKTRGKAVITLKSTKPNHWYIKTETEGTLMVPEGELEIRK